jgi:hypothetical protein
MTEMKYVRLFAGADGESHFEDVPVEFISEPPNHSWCPHGNQLNGSGS